MTHLRLEKIVDEMSLEEQVSILSGEDFWSLPAIERLNIPKARVTDGPNGARGGGSLIGGVTAAAFPVGIALGATWDPDLTYEIGAAIAQEVKSKGAHVSLAPTVNIQRCVTNGRNFECYSEDPELTADLAVGYIKGLQDNGIAATIKHFVGNESEIERTTMSSEIDKRSLREIYLRPFEAAVKDAGTWGIMSSYNKLNGSYTAENKWLLTDVLREDWRYDGIVMSDWFGARSTAQTVNAGLDLEMPGPTRYRGDKLVGAVHAGDVNRETIRECALNVLRWMERCGALDDHSDWVEIAVNNPEHRALIRRAGAEAAVLLKNDDALLPLAKSRDKIALIGPNAKVAQIMGGGSAQLNPHYQITPFDAIISRLDAASISYAKGCTNHRWEPVLKGDFSVEYFNNTEFSGPPVHREKSNKINTFWMPPPGGPYDDPNVFSVRAKAVITVDEGGIYRLGLHCAGLSKAYVDGTLIVDAWSNWTKGRTFFEEGCDEVVGEVELRAGQSHEVIIEYKSKPSDNLLVSAIRLGLSKPLSDCDIDEAVVAAKQAETAVVFVGRSGEWDTEGSDLRDIALPGRQDELVMAVAAVNPNTVVVLQTGGPVEMPWLKHVKSVVQFWYPGQEVGNVIADVLFGDAEPAGRLPQSFPVKLSDNPTATQDDEFYPGVNGKVRYEEGLFIGYRHYDKHGIEPLFPFGFGLSYTSFEMGDVEVSADGLTVNAIVSNTGLRAGSTVVQLYIGDDEASVERPIRELKGFGKIELAAGATGLVEMEIDPRDYAFFDMDAQVWRVEEGDFTLSFGFCATTIDRVLKVRRASESIAV